MRLSPLFAILLPAAAFAQSLPATAPAVPFTISKETTFFTAPLRPDGTVDFPAALNQKLSQDVTPDNNGYVLWLQITGTRDAVLSPKTKTDFLKALGTTALPADAETWEAYTDFIKRTKGIEKLDPFGDEFADACRAPWVPQDHPDLVAFLQSHQRLLDLAVKAADRSHWWYPLLPSDGHTFVSVMLPSLGTVLEVAKALCARAFLRASSGDFDGFLADIKAVRQLARHQANSPTLMERFIGVAIEASAANAMGALAAQGQLSTDQCQAAIRSWNELPPLPSVAEAIDTSERLTLIDTIQWIAVGRADLIGGRIDDSGARSDPFAQIDIKSVDWNEILKTTQAALDAYVQAFHAHSISQIQTQVRDADNRFGIPSSNIHLDAASMALDPFEPLAEYTARVTQYLFVVLMPSIDHAEIIRRSAIMQAQMTRTLLAAAAYRARTGKWPAALNDLVPNDLKEIPRDIYSADNTGTEAILYTLTPSGPRVFSIGEGRRDFGIGAPKPTAPNSDLP